MEGTNFSNGDFTGRIFNRCTFDNETCFRNAIVKEARFINCTVNGGAMSPQWLYNQCVIGFNDVKIGINQAEDRKDQVSFNFTS